MLWVAFSRRMCCSRVWSARTKPRRPSTSVVSPAIRPGMRRMCSSVAQKKPNDGPPKSRRPPSGCPSPTATSIPQSPGGRRTPSVIGSTEAIAIAPASWAAEASAVEVLDRRRGSSGSGRRRRPSRRRGLSASSSAFVRPFSSPTSTIVGAVALRVGLERLAAVRVEAAGDDELRASLLRARAPGTRREATDEGPRTSRRSRPGAPSAPTCTSGTRTSPEGRPGRPRAGTACRESGTRSATGSRRRSPARSGRTCRRPGSRPRNRRRRSAPRASAGARRRPARTCRPAAPARGQAHLGRDLLEELLGGRSADLGEHRLPVGIGC